MKHLPVIFQDKDAVYEADTCEELKRSSGDQDVYLRAWSHAPYPGAHVPNDYIPEVRSLGVWDADHTQSWGLLPHCNEGIELSFLAGGHVDFGVDDQLWRLKSGQLAMTRPWQMHRIGNPNVTASRLYWLILDVDVRRPNQPWKWPDWLILKPRELKQLTELLRHNEQPIWDANSEISDIFHKLILLVESATPEESETKVKLYINELLLALLAMLISQKISLTAHLSTSERVVGMFLDAIKDHLSYNWSLEVMAKQCGLSRSQFSNYCKDLTNMTPIQYLSHCRHEAALGMLVNHPQMPIQEIALECGFNSSQYFSTTFQNRYGCSPREHRERSMTLGAE